MNPQPPHFIVEEGPERGREILVPADGARIGRATENDICLADAAMSRFQCRVYFREGFLHIMDLGSTNETLVNNKPVSDQALRYGDKLLIGESLLRVVNDGLTIGPAAPAAASLPAPAPIVFQPDLPEAPPAPIALPDELPKAPTHTPSVLETGIDLGLGRRDSNDSGSDSGGHEKRNNMPLLLVTLVTMLVVFGVGVVILLITNKPPPRVQAPDNSLRVYYEKVQSGNGNIFRFAIELAEDGKLKAWITDLNEETNMSPDIQIDPESLKQFREQLLNHQDIFYTLRDSYEGLPVGRHESASITLVYGRDPKQVRIANQLEPDAFKTVRETIEAFADDKLGLAFTRLPAAERRSRSAIAWENAQKFYREREVKDSNLWDATQQLKEVEWLLQSIEPKPEYYRDAVQFRQEWLRELSKQVDALVFEANRSSQMGDKNQAAVFFRRILATFPDKNHQLYRQAYSNLLRIEQEFK
jgi:hypothetical protein